MLTHTVIRRTSGWAALNLSEVWRYRELLFFFAWRDVLVRYKQTVIGVLWAIVRPALSLAVLVFVFSRLAKLPSDGVPYPLLALVGLLPWQLFSNGFGESSASILGGSSMISKIYFPRIIAPLSATIASLVDLLIMFVLVFLLMIYFGFTPGWQIVALPFFVVICLLFTAGLGILFAALVVKYRDIRHVIPFILQLGLYLSPVGFTSSIVPEQYRLVYALNPMVGIIDGFRWSLLGTKPPEPTAIVIGIVSSVVIFVAGAFYFRRTERDFADII